MKRFRGAVSLAVCLGFFGPPALSGTPQDGVALTVDRAVSLGDLALTWSGGEAPYLVYRSQDPAAVVAGATRIATSAGTSLDVPEGPTQADYFLVVNIDRNSGVAATSGCLTVGTNAVAAVELDLRDSQGRPIPDAAVAMVTTEGTLGAVVADGGIYRAVLEPPAVVPAPAEVSVTADGVALAVPAVVAFAEPVTATAGGAGGCPADGNIRVRVVDEAGLPLAGARVMVGQAESVAVYRTSPGGPTDGGNTAFTGPDGYAELHDYGDALDGPQAVTAAATADRTYVTFLDIDAADVVLPLELVDPAPPTEVFTGDLTNVPAPNGDPVELGVMLPDVTIEAVLGFRIAELLADDECYDAGGVAGSQPLPGNAYIPDQCGLWLIFFCAQQLPEHEYTSAPLPFGDRRLLALRGSAPLASLTAGDLTQVLTTITLNGIGVVPTPAAAPGPTRVDLPVTSTLAANMSCTIDGAPDNADVFCVAAGDWDSATDGTLTPGSGRLFVSGFRLGDATGATGPFSIAGVTTVTDTGDFADIDYVAGAVAQYNDPLKPGIPPGTADGTSAIIDRSGTSFDGTGGTVAFGDFFPIRTLQRVGRDFVLSALPGDGHPVPHLGRVTIEREIDETYTACLPDDSTRQRRLPLWEVWLPGGTDAWSLPLPPPDWPRAAPGGELAGLFDPLATPEIDRLRWSASSLHLATQPGFDFDRLFLPELRLHLTHVTRNEMEY